MLTVSQMPSACITSQPIHVDSARDSQYSEEVVLDAEISHVLNSVKDLLKKYRMYSKASESNVVSGGLQQYITRALKQNKVTPDKSTLLRLHALYINDTSSVHLYDDIYNNQEPRNTARFNLLPVNVKLLIFSFLTANELCRASRVCREWYQLTSDCLLWQQRLNIDLRKWNTISHTANPNLYHETKSDLADKQIYFKCCPEIQVYTRCEVSTFHHVSQVLKSFLPKKAPRIAMLGPGLESNTSGIVKKMLYEDTHKFQRVAMFPGQFEGFGAGMTLKLPSGNNFHLTVLYSSTKREREANTDRNRLATSKLINKLVQKSGDEDIVSYELQQSMKDLCHTLDAFIFVVDASGPLESVNSGRSELFAMVNERWSDPHVPILVLSCIPESTSPRLPAIDIVEALHLADLNRPWLVQNAVVEGLVDVVSGIQWLVDQSQYK